MKRRIYRMLFVTAGMSCIVASSFAQKTGPTFSGYVDASYNYNFNKATTNSLRSFDSRTNQIALNSFHFAATGTPSSKVSYLAELDFGTDAGVYGTLHQGSGLPSPLGVELQEAAITYAFSDKVSLTGGKFVTFEGIELIEGPSNPTISRGYLFGLAEPSTHVGGYFTFVPSSQFDIKIGVINGWDLLVDNNMDKSIIGRLGVNLGDPLAFGISFISGVEQANSADWRHSLDLTGITKAVSSVALNFQANYGMETFAGTDAKWFGFTVQPVVSLSDAFDLGLRAEYFADDQGARTGVPDLNVFNVTLTPTLKCDGVTFRFEYRFDNSNKEVFLKDTGTAKNSSTVSFEIFCLL